MRFAYDTEFIENGSTIDLISIGMVAEDGREMYAVSSEFSITALHANPWLVENVRPSLPGEVKSGCRCINGWHLDREHPDVRSRAQIARMVQAFVLGTEAEQATAGTPYVELWADYGAYDHVALCQLWGRMIDLPDGMPMFTRDIQQRAADRPDVVLPPDSADVHNALADARHVMACLRALDSP